MEMGQPRVQAILPSRLVQETAIPLRLPNLVRQAQAVALVQHQPNLAALVKRKAPLPPRRRAQAALVEHKAHPHQLPLVQVAHLVHAHKLPIIPR